MRVRARPDCHQELPDGRTNPSITAGREYVVAGYDWTSFRLVDDHGEPILFERFLFDVVDPTEDPPWVREAGDDEDYYVDPPDCAAPGFYEDWHDGDPVARETFAKVFAALVADDRRRQTCGLLAAFIDGPDRSLSAAGRLEVALDEAFPDDDECQDLVLALASYRPGGGDYLYGEKEILAQCRRLLPHLRGVLAPPTGER